MFDIDEPALKLELIFRKYGAEGLRKYLKSWDSRPLFEMAALELNRVGCLEAAAVITETISTVQTVEEWLMAPAAAAASTLMQQEAEDAVKKLLDVVKQQHDTKLN